MGFQEPYREAKKRPGCPNRVPIKGRRGPFRKVGNLAGMRDFEWRDPDSNRGHHDFQAPGAVAAHLMKVLQTGKISMARRPTGKRQVVRTLRAIVRAFGPPTTRGGPNEGRRQPRITRVSRAVSSANALARQSASTRFRIQANAIAAMPTPRLVVSASCADSLALQTDLLRIALTLCVVQKLPPLDWFGPAWDAELCATRPRIKTPVGERCAGCGGPVQVGMCCR